MRVSQILIAAIMIGQPSLAAAEGKLDLSLVTPIGAPARGQKDLAPLPKDLWAPGSPLFTRDESAGVQAYAYAGNAALSGVGLAQNAHGFGHNRESTAIEAGFGAILGIQLWNFWKLLMTPESKR